jgi:hypothetical protein
MTIRTAVGLRFSAPEGFLIRSIAERVKERWGSSEAGDWGRGDCERRVTEETEGEWRSAGEVEVERPREASSSLMRRDLTDGEGGRGMLSPRVEVR